MVVACHPTYVTERTYSWSAQLPDRRAGVLERLHKLPEKIFELG